MTYMGVRGLFCPKDSTTHSNDQILINYYFQCMFTFKPLRLKVEVRGLLCPLNTVLLHYKTDLKFYNC